MRATPTLPTASSRRQLPTAAPYRLRPQRGIVAIGFPILLIVIMGFMGLALDLSRLYNRKVELQAAADAAALAAARELNGTATGIQNALAKAASAVAKNKYGYNRTSFAWSDSAISFSDSASGGWTTSSNATAGPGSIAFVRVDTNGMDAAASSLTTVLMHILSPSFAVVSTKAEAVAGRSSVRVDAIAVCALSSTPAASRLPGPELVEYGFRRGVGYDLMQLNPAGASGLTFVVNPIDPASAAGSSTNTQASVVAPYACSGTLPKIRVSGTQIRVGSPYPLAELAVHLNSRFDDYSGGVCKYPAIAPDVNVKPYYRTGTIPWMMAAPATQTATGYVDTVKNRLATIADPEPLPGSNTTGAYGVLWSYARPVPFSAYTAGSPEPANGYAPFSTSQWNTLYDPGRPAPRSYPLNGPYMTGAGNANFQGPDLSHGLGIRHRRVLNVPLLSCPVAAGPNSTASVLAIGRFFMTVPATTGSISAEFAGIASEANLGGPVELYK